MIFRPRVQRLSSDTILEIVDDMIEIASISSNKQAYRLELLHKRLQQEKLRTMIKPEELKKAVEVIRSKDTSNYQLKRTFIKLSNQLNSYYTQLLRILKILK